MKQVVFSVLSLSFAVVCLVDAAAAQGPPPDAQANPNGVVKIIPEPSLATLPNGERFVSTEGAFSIAMPLSISGYSEHTPATTGGTATGGSFSWRLREGVFVVSYFHYLTPEVTTEKDFTDSFAGFKDSFITRLKATIVTERDLNLGKMRGHEFKFRLPSGQIQIARMFVLGKEAYNMMAIINSNAPDAEPLVEKAFDSFALIDRADINSDIQKRLEQATPAALPQTPVAARETSDAVDRNLRGPVKTVREETSDVTGTTTEDRRLRSVTDYNESGNFVKEIDYDSDERPWMVNVYGYIDGSRVLRSGYISYENDPPPVAASPRSAAPKPRDTRYDLKYLYTYKNGKLVEIQLIRNDGTPSTKTIYKYNGSEVETTVFSEDGKLNQKYVYKLDEKGNHVEEFDADVLNFYGDRKTSISYDEFDDHGNWTKATKTLVTIKDGKEIRKSTWITYRTITYYK